MPRKNKPHSERRKKTKKFRSKVAQLEKSQKTSKYKSLDDNYSDEIEEFGWEEYSDRWEEARR